MARYNRWLLNWWPLVLIPLIVSLAAAVWGAVTMTHERPPHAAQTQTAAAQDVGEDLDGDERRGFMLFALTEQSLKKKGLHYPMVGIAAGLVANGSDGTDASETTGTLGEENEQATAESVEPEEPRGSDLQKAFEESRAEASKAYEDVERTIAEQAKRAHVVIELDRAMQVGRDYTASLIIEGGLGKNIASLTQATIEPVATELDVEIAPDAEAYASSSQFAVTPITPAKQAIRSQAPTVWQWTLTPRRDGDASLMIILRQNVRVGSSIFTFPVRQFPQVITVELTWWLWLRDLVTSFWGFVTAILVAGASLATIFSAWKNREQRATEPPAESNREVKPVKPGAPRRRPA